MESTELLGEQIHICYFHNIANGSALKQRLISAASGTGKKGDTERERVNFAFVDAAMICSPLHLRSAIQQALLARDSDGLRTKTVHSEILYALHPSHNISDAIRQFGVGGETRDLLVIRVGSCDDRSSSPLTKEEISKRMLDAVQAEIVDLNVGIAQSAQWEKINKVYRLPGTAWWKPGHGLSDAQLRESQEATMNIIISTVSSKSLLS